MIVVSLLLILVSGGLLATGILQANDPFVMASIGVSVLAAAALFLGIRQQRGDVDRTVGHDNTAPAGRTAQPGAGRVTPAGATAVRAPAQPVRPAGAAKVEPVAKAPPADPVLKADPAVRAPTGSASVTAPPVTPPPVTPPAVAVPPPGATPSGEVTETQIIDADAVQPSGAAVPAAPATSPPPVVTPATEPDEPEEPDEPPGLDDDEDPPDEPAPELLMASEVSRLAELDSEVLVVDGRPRYHLAGCPHLVDKENQPLPVSEAVELGFTACSLCGAATAVLTEASKT